MELPLPDGTLPHKREYFAEFIDRRGFWKKRKPEKKS